MSKERALRKANEVLGGSKKSVERKESYDKTINLNLKVIGGINDQMKN